MGATRNQKKILLVVGGTIALLAVAAATVFLLSRLNGAPQSKSQNASSSTPVAAADVIKDLRATIPASLNGFSEQPATDGQFKITVKNSGKPFSVAVGTKNILWMTKKEKGDVSNASTILSDAKSFFESKGLHEVLAGTGSASFESDMAVCQVQVQIGEFGGVLYGCTSTEVAKSEYEAVAKLIGLYNQAHASSPLTQTSFAGAERTVQQRDSVQGAIVSLLPSSSTGTGKVLLFGALGEKWEYVADLTTGNSTGKANVPEEALPAIKDKKWNGVLAGLVGVE